MSSIGLISENDNSTVLAEYTGLNRVATSFQSEDALEKELISSNIPYIREKHLSVYYNTGNGEATELQHTFRADFYCYNSIIVEIKSKYIDEKGKLSVKQQINNYMAATKSNYALMLNFYGNNDNVYYTTFPHNLWLEIKDNINPSINCPEEQLERIL